mmetsp:Transcript_3812/g.9017  ORF Transcript_3812/g.9017 Transcript_3812/m.9017 type:complete len:245 (+) Transcript_3812:1208-1942(+)
MHGAERSDPGWGGTELGARIGGKSQKAQGWGGVRGGHRRRAPHLSRGPGPSRSFDRVRGAGRGGDRARRKRRQGGRKVPRRQLFGPDLADECAQRKPRVRKRTICAGVERFVCGVAGRGHRLDQRQPVRQRGGPFHEIRRRRPEVPERGGLRERGHQRADPGAASHVQLQRLAGVHPGRPSLLRKGGGPILHQKQGRHVELAVWPGGHLAPGGGLHAHAQVDQRNGRSPCFGERPPFPRPSRWA